MNNIMANTRTHNLLKNIGWLLIVTNLLFALLLCNIAISTAQDDDTGDAPTATEEAAEPDATPASGENLQLIDTDIEVAIEPTGNNGYCTICHNQPLRTTRLGDGTILNLFVNPAMIQASVHGPTDDSPGLGCLDCHGDDVFPHNQPTPFSGRLYTLDANSMCTSCHVNQAEQLSSGLHAQAIEAGNLEAAVCTDCHSAHHIQSAENRPELVAGVCGDCHETTFAEWQISDHSDIGPLGCASCHSYHAQTLRIGDTTTELCMNCHAGEMPSVYAHEIHNVAQEIENDVVENGLVECADCHMYVDETLDQISRIALNAPFGDAHGTGHTMLLDSTPCTTCHQQLEESGEWDTLISARFGETGAVDLDTDVPDDNETVPVEEALDPETAAPNATLQALQGLLLGLGLGVTFAVVFIARGNRRPTDTHADETATDSGGHE